MGKGIYRKSIKKGENIKNIYSRVEAATVTFSKNGGQAVLVRNSYLITAAHCLEYDFTRGLFFLDRDHILYEIETTQGEKLKVSPYIIESCNDIAVLSSPDGQIFPKEANKYEDFCHKTKPVLLSKKFMYAKKLDAEKKLGLDSFQTEPASSVFNIHIHSHKKTWILGKATIYASVYFNPPFICVDTEENIEAGTSGGPIINDAGEIVSIVSNSGGSNGETKEGFAPALPWSLPIWIYREIMRR